jgi:hypothetical protein
MALRRLPARRGWLGGPCVNATLGRVLGSGEDVRAVDSWRPLRSASDRGCRCAGECTRAHRASGGGAPARSHHEELAARALTKVPRSLSGAALHSGGASARPQWKPPVVLPQVASGHLGRSPTGSYPIKRSGGCKASCCCPGASSLRRAPRGPRATWRVAIHRHGRRIQNTLVDRACQEGGCSCRPPVFAARPGDRSLKGRLAALGKAQDPCRTFPLYRRSDCANVTACGTCRLRV